MKKYTLTKKQLTFVKLEDIKLYFIKNKWSIIDSNQKQMVFQSPTDSEGNQIRYKLPNSETYQNYLNAVSDVISIFSKLRNVPIITIYNDLIHTSKDIMRMRIINTGNYKYSIPLDIAATNINAIKNLYMYSACSEVNKQPHFEKPLAEGINHANNCQFGHTFEGSFGFTIDTPIIKEDLLLEELTTVPFERKVTERIITGFNSVIKAKNNMDSDFIVRDFEDGFNARMCESIADLSNNNSTPLEFQINWSGAISPRSDISSFTSIMLDAIDIELLIEAGKKLKKVEPFDDVIVGQVVTLHSNKDPNSNEDFNRTIVMKHEVDNHIVDVKLNLNKENYLLAYEAHGSGKRIIVKGKLFRTGNTWRMNDITSLDYIF